MKIFSKRYKYHLIRNLEIAIPVSISQLGHILVGNVDTAVSGKWLGENALHSATLAYTIFWVLMIFGIGASIGATSLIAQADGEENKNEIKSLLMHSCVVDFLIGVFITVMMICSIYVYPYISDKPHIIKDAIPFGIILSFSMIPIMMYQVFKQFMEGLAITRQATLISLTSNVVNVVFIVVLTFGWAGLPEMGLNGIAWATFIARLYMLAAIVVFFLRDARFRFYRNAFSDVPIRMQKIFSLLRMSVPMGMQMALEAGAFSFAAILVGYIGTNEVAAHQVALSMAAVTYMISSGLAASANVRVGYEFGRKDYEQLWMAGISNVHMALVLMGTFALMFVLLRSFLPWLYSDNTIVISMASSLLFICAMFQISDGVQATLLGALRGIGDVKIPTLLVLCGYWAFGLPLGWFLAFRMNMNVFGIWYGLLMALTCIAITLYLRFRIKVRALKKNHSMPIQLYKTFIYDR